MASLSGFSKRIERRARLIERNIDNLVKETAIAIDQAVVLATPVDTGRARANWQVSLSVPISGAINKTDVSGSQTISQAAGVIDGRRSGQAIIITNPLPYIVPLNEGSSAQAPAMFVEIGIQEGVNLIRRTRVTV